MLGIDPQTVEVVHCDPAPPARTGAGSIAPTGHHRGLAIPGEQTWRSWRAVLPHCDVLLVATTQQKYRSARVLMNWRPRRREPIWCWCKRMPTWKTTFASDWQKNLEPHYEAGQFVLRRFAGRTGRRPGRPRATRASWPDSWICSRSICRHRRQAASAGRTSGPGWPTRSRRAAARTDAARPPSRSCNGHLQQRAPHWPRGSGKQIAASCSLSRRHWESARRCPIASRWGFSPFALMLRVVQGLGGLVARAVLLAGANPGPDGALGDVGGRSHLARLSRQPPRRPGGSAGRGPPAGIRPTCTARPTILAGYAAEAGLPSHDARPETIDAEAGQAVTEFCRRGVGEIDRIINRLADLHPAGSRGGVTSCCCWRCWACWYIAWGRISSTIPGSPHTWCPCRHRFLPLGRVLAGLVVSAVVLVVHQSAASRFAPRDRPVAQSWAAPQSPGALFARFGRPMPPSR